MRIFKEEQRFTETWLIVLLTISMLVPMFIIFKEFSKENTTMSLNEFLFSIILMPLCILPIFFFKLKTRIDEKGIHFQFFPFHFKPRTIAWSELKSANTRKYYAITEYGGWGLKTSFLSRKKKGIAYTVSGELGLQLELKAGKKILIGTQLLNDVNSVLNTYKEKIHTNEN
ncbi:MAG: hypothetical protein P8I51_01120 [Polaribacter sp.]|jgi:hypothetical protein|nr:hypothetical protein [Polaribacter sp.]MDG1953476.1 hypothetical protein [Polaribacter sp.]MDG2074204.1 hypothetical protein [Polaribacter sp.]